MIKKLEWLFLFIVTQLNCSATNPDVDKFYQIKNISNYERRAINLSDSLNNEHSIMTHHYKNGHRKLMVMAHGYIDNCGYVKPLQRWFIGKGFDILCLELPGHGLSSGERANIEDFVVYRDVYKEVFKSLPSSYDDYYFYGHSTGAVGMMEHLLENESHPFKKIILAAPLVRSHLWELSKFGMRYFGFLIKRLPTRRLSLTDDEYKKLLELDPTLIRSTPKAWFQKLVNWNKNLENDGRRSEEEIVTIFAGNDSVIDQDFNESFYRERFSKLKVYHLPNSDHAFHYESDSNKKVFYTILSSLF